jgi:DNA replication and repair protein RecF
VGQRVFGQGKEVAVAYRPAVAEVGEVDPDDLAGIERCVRLALERGRAGEARARRCLVGPQRDDLRIELDGRPAESHASAGEQRRLAFVLVMAALEQALGARRAAAGRLAAVLLVDDVEAEFDDQRLDRVFGFLRERGAQALVATSKDAVLRQYGPEAQVLRVDGGVLRPAR